MDAHYQSIYLSPHLDDAVLSCGGQIYQQVREGMSVLIVTVMAGEAPPEPVSGYALSLHQRWQLDADAIEKRRAEDVAACQLVGATHLHWDLPDCIYRRHPVDGQALYQSDAEIFGRLHPAEEPLVHTLAQQMANLPSHDRVLLPLTVGNHVDHQLTREAAEQGLKPSELTYYEEYPYAQKKDALSQYAGWQSEVIPLADVALDAKIAAILCYRSQVSTFFEDHDDLAAQVVNYTRSTGGERLWNR